MITPKRLQRYKDAARSGVDERARTFQPFVEARNADNQQIAVATSAPVETKTTDATSIAPGDRADSNEPLHRD